MRIEANEAKEKLYEIIGKLEYGEEEKCVITMKGQPVAAIVSYENAPRKIKLGVAKGKIKVPSFEEWQAMDKEVAEMFGV